MSWLVVGAYGQLGKAITFVLKERGIDFNAPLSKDLDITSTPSCLNYIHTLYPEVILNAAAWTNVDGAESEPDSAHAVNEFGALNLALAAKKINSIFVHISTDYVFSGVSTIPWKESDVRAPISVYGASKAAGEVAVLGEYSANTYVFRTAWLYSKWGKNFAKTMARIALFSDNEVKVVNDQVGQPTSALDLANQIVDSVLAKLPFGIYHATNSGQATWFEFSREIFSFCGSENSLDRIVPIDSSSIVLKAKRPKYSVLGHQSWNLIGTTGVNVPIMRDWKLALREYMPEIVSQLHNERGQI
jgi:dTDP-4-dehydrorhamnose reductase